MNKLLQGQKIIILLLALLILIILTTVMKNIRNSSNDSVRKIDYKTSNGESLIGISTVVNDRIIYWELNDIVSQYINSYFLSANATSEQKEEFVSYKDYYNILDDNYKKYISKSKYYKKSEEFLKKFVIGENTDNEESMYTTNIIKSVYEYDDNKYICVFKDYSSSESNQEEINSVSKDVYLGVELDTDSKAWKIFFIG